ncbi:MAG TPA: alpha/beta hydrolase [Microvirga sp.]|jgi:pimeloyl-ACP methyl ester carboxylesterase
MRPPLVLLPGMMCDGRLFEPQVAALGGAILVGDITRSDSVSALAEDVLADIPYPRFALAGLSMGGIVAMQVVAKAPDRVTHLALLDTNHLAETPERQALREPQIARVREGRLREVLVDEMKPNYLGPAHRDDAALLDRVLAMGIDLGPAVFERQSRALRDRPDATEALRRFAGPSLVLCGRHDRLCPVERHEAMAALLERARLAVIEEAGHLTTLEAPDAVSEHLARWLEEPV